MKSSFKLMISSLLLLVLIVPAKAGYAPAGKEQLAISAATRFAQLIDDGNFQAAFWSGSDLLHRANDTQSWIDQTTRTQLVLGKVEERKLKSVRPLQHFPSLPDDDYLILLYDSRTTYKANAAEVILLHQINDLWQVCSYSIR